MSGTRWLLPGSNATTSSIRASSGAITGSSRMPSGSRISPERILHGRFDVVTPFKNTWDLARAWPKAELRIVPDAGHAMTEPGIMHEMVTATDKYAGAPRS